MAESPAAYPKYYFGRKWIGNFGKYAGLFLLLISVALMIKGKSYEGAKLAASSAIVFYSSSIYRKPRYILNKDGFEFIVGTFSHRKVEFKDIESFELKKYTVGLKMKDGKTLNLGGSVPRPVLNNFYTDFSSLFTIWKEGNPQDKKLDSIK